MWRLRALACLLAGAAMASGDRRAGTPVDKVITLLEKLSLQVEKQGKEEAESYDKYACFCNEQTSEKNYVIKRSGEKISLLDAEITALGDDITKLDADVVARKADVTKEEDAAKKDLDARKKEHDAFVKERDSWAEAVKVVEAAVAALEASKEGVSSKKAASLLLEARRTIERVPNAGASLLALGQLVDRLQDPGTAKAYKYQSKDVIGVLQGLAMTFKDQLAKEEMDEATKRHAYDMTANARAQRIAALEKEISLKEKISAEKSEEKSEKEGTATDEKAALAKDEAFLKDLTAQCDAKAKAWDKRSKARADELTVMSEAVGLLKGMGDAYNVNKRLVDLLVRRQAVRGGAGGREAAVQQHAPALLQFASGSHASGAAGSVASFLHGKALLLKSKLLDAASAAAREAAAPDHFVRVRGIINDLIKRLEDEAKAEADQKSFCDENMKTAIEKRDKYMAAMEGLSAKIDATTSDIKTLKTEVADLSSEIADLHTELNEMTKIRTEEKAQNGKTVKEADEGAKAVKQAIDLLKKYYGGLSLAQAFRTRQTPTDREGNTVSDLAPETFEGDYKGRSGESKGVIGLLEVIAADFERTSQTTKDAEAKAAADFTTQSGKLNDQITAKKKTKKDKEADITTKDADLILAKDDYKAKHKLHAGSLDELEKLRASCVDGAESWEERTKRRNEEIAALKQALQILEDWKS